MSDQPAETTTRVEATGTIKMREQPASWLLVALTIVALLGASALVLFGMVWLRYENASDDQIDALRQRTAAQVAGWKDQAETAEARAADLEQVLTCRQDLLLTLKDAQGRAIRANGDLIRATAETFNDLVIHGEAPPPDPLGPSIDAVNAANGDVDRALAAYSAACPVPIEQGG